MKPFNLQEALAGKPVVTRDGRTAVGFHVFPDATYQRVHAVIGGYVVSFNDNGSFWNNGSPASDDLFMASEKKEGWVNVYPSNSGYGSIMHLTEEDARKYKASDLIATVRIEWEE